MKHLLVSDGTKSFKREDIPKWEVWISRITNPMHTALEQNRQLRVDQLVTDIERHDKEGAFWALKTDPGKRVDELPFPLSGGWVDYMCGMRTRLAAFTDKEKRLINWGYIQCDLAVRSSYINDLTESEDLHFPEYGFAQKPAEKRRNSKRFRRRLEYRRIRTGRRPGEA